MCGVKSMPAKQKKLGILTERGWLIALAVAVGLVLGMVGPTSAQFFNFGGFQQQPRPQRGGGGFGGGWFGNDVFSPSQPCRAAAPLEWAASATGSARRFFKGATA